MDQEVEELSPGRCSVPVGVEAAPLLAVVRGVAERPPYEDLMIVALGASVDDEFDCLVLTIPDALRLSRQILRAVDAPTPDWPP